MVTNVTVKGVECVANLSGKAATSLASFLLAALKDEKRVSGKTRMRSFRGKPTQVFVIKRSELKEFAQEAKKYGVLYAAIVDKRNPDGVCDIVVSADDAGKVNRIADRFALTAVDVEKIRADIIKARKMAAEYEQPKEQAAEAGKPLERPDPPSDKAHTVSDADLGEMLGQPVPKTQMQPVKVANENPTTTRTKTRQSPSGPFSASSGSFGKAADERTSVRKDMQQIRNDRAAREKEPHQQKQRQVTEHRQPKKERKQKSKGRYSIWK